MDTTTVSPELRRRITELHRQVDNDLHLWQTLAAFRDISDAFTAETDALVDEDRDKAMTDCGLDALYDVFALIADAAEYGGRVPHGRHDAT